VKPISVQLYSLREASAEDFDSVLERLADIGYKGVEPFNLFGKPAQAFAAQVNDLGMTISSSHFPWANRADVSEVIDVIGALGLNRAAGGFGPDDFADASALQRTAEITNGLVEALGSAGIDLFLHNHWWEFGLIDGAPAYHKFQSLCPDVQFEIDTYWAANFGARDPAEEVARVRQRAPLLHIKDGPLERDHAHVAVGDGKMDVAGVIAAADPAVLEWLIVELDACDTDMFEAVERSYAYLTSNQLAQGNV
jgi:sugar phosphate isomerase/epimerase